RTMDKLKKLIKRTSIGKGNYIGSLDYQQETERPSNNTSGPFTYTWIIKNFQDLYNQKNLEYYYSDTFISPTNEQSSIDENSNDTTENTIINDKIEHKWRLLL